MPVEKVKVEIYGESYILKGDASPEYMEMLAGLINEKMNYIAERSKRLPASKIAILTAINIADELMKLRQENSKMIEKLSGGRKDAADDSADEKESRSGRDTGSKRDKNKKGIEG